MTRHILVAIDLTHEEDARKILVEARKLADCLSASLSAMTVIPDFGASWVGTFFKEGAMHEAAEAASRALHTVVHSVMPDREVQHIVEVGIAYERILHRVDETDVDLVVMGAHKPDLKDRLAGPNASRVVRAAPVSVMVLRL